MPDVPLSELPIDEKARRASSFGGVAETYEAFRPGPSNSAIEWILGGRHVTSAVDLGAGTGACTRLLLQHAEQVTAVEPDQRMRDVLESEVPAAAVFAGQGESIPLPDCSMDAVLASSSWHWMDPGPTLKEVARVLRPGGLLGVLWSGPDPEGPFLVQARALLESQAVNKEGSAGAGSSQENLADVMLADADRPPPTLAIPADGDVPLEQPEFAEFGWDMALNADQMIGLLSTLSLFILMPEERRLGVFSETRRLLRDALGIEGPVTVDIAFKTDAWRAERR